MCAPDSLRLSHCLQQGCLPDSMVLIDHSELPGRSNSLSASPTLNYCDRVYSLLLFKHRYRTGSTPVINPPRPRAGGV